MATKILAIDVGDRKIGLAIGDPAIKFAWARPTLVVNDWLEAWEPIKNLINSQQVDQVVIGLPLNTDGSARPQAERSREFGAQLGEVISVPVAYIDERFTTQAVQHTAADPNTNEDSQAAQLILETFMQSLS